MNLKKYLLITIISLIICFTNVNALDITDFSSYAGDQDNSKCKNNVCATDIFNSGIRVTMVDYNGNQVNGTKIVNFWPTATIAGYAKDGVTINREIPQNSSTSTVYGCTKYNFNMNATNTYENIYDAKLGLPLNRNVHLYQEYFLTNSNGNKFGTTAAKTIISYLTYNSTNDFSSYYLKIEPIYIIKENYYKQCNYFVGTSSEIYDMWSQYRGDTNIYVNGYRFGSYGASYLSGGDNNPIVGPWHVVRNYITSIYYDCSSNGPSVACYDSSVYGGLNNYTKENKNIGTLINLYKNGNGLGVGYIKISDYVDTCQSRATALINNKEGLTALYLEYKTKGEDYDYKNLLNFSNPVCSVKKTSDCDSSIDSKIGCFSGGVTTSGSVDNLSCYNQTITATSLSGMPVIGYCLTNLNMINKLGQDSFSGISGRLLINTKEFLDSSITMYCTFPEVVVADSIQNLNNLTNSNFLEYSVSGTNISQDDQYSISPQNNSSFYIIELKSTLSFTKKYAYNGSGIVTETDCDNCKDLGYGYVTKLTDTSSEINFAYKFKIQNKVVTNMTFACPYTVTPEIIEVKDNESGNNTALNELNLEFRNVETANPFPGQSGTGRESGSNWNFNKTEAELDLNGDGKVDSSDLVLLQTELTKGTIDLTNSKYDIYLDGNVNERDINFFRYVLDSGNISDKDLLKNYIFEITNDSYNRTGEGPIYSFTLTPSLIKKIREDYGDRPYDDYTLKCANGVCKSTVLEELGISRLR